MLKIFKKKNKNLSRQNRQEESPEDLLRKYEEQKFKEIEKEAKREIFIERYKTKIFKWTKWGCSILIFIFVFAIAVNNIIPRIIIPSYPSPSVSPKFPQEFKIETEQVKLLPNYARKNVYDVVAKIKNSHPDFGAPVIDYKFILKDFLGNVVGERSGQSYILPQQSRFIVELAIPCDRPAESLEFEVKPESLQKFKNFENPQSQIKISGQNFSVLDNKTKVWADIYNESIFGFGKVEINFIVYNNKNEIIGVNYTNVNDLAPATKRYVSAFWDYSFDEQIERIELEANVNVYDSRVFMEQYGEGQRLEY